MKTQAQRVIEKFGGEAQVALALGLAPSTVYRWNYSKARGGSDGVIPSVRLRQLLAVAQKKGITITAQDLYPTA